MANSRQFATVSQVELFKYQALGNDYLILDLPGPLDELVAVLPELCDRHRGLGSDGLLAFDPHAMSVRIFNPDRSEAQKSGNGLRIIAAHAVLDHGAGDAFELATADRSNAVRVLERNGAEVVTELDIGRPSFRAADLPADFPGEPEHVDLDTPAGRVQAVLVSVGNPHCVVFDQAVTRERCLELGPHLEVHPAFPERTNVQLCEVVDRARVRAEIWERGAGYTLASGTSASAVAAACMRRNLVESHVTVQMPGGDLRLHREANGNLVQAGPARRVYRALIELSDFDASATRAE
ncbi:MAG: diaminopimelate epimerase [Chloroflexi bacterium]|nr:MAG: diaminopimelate epimerase [Chloroflexota bacterium]